MRLELFHLSLAPKPNLFAAMEQNGAPIDREAWIRILFSRSIEFTHRGAKYHYAPQTNPFGDSSVLIFGKIGRKVKSDENAPPEQGLEEVSRDSWRAATVIIDPTKHEEGQKLAMQARDGVGAPFSVLKSLMTFASQSVFEAPFVIDVRPLTDPAGFWDFVNANRGKITSITLEFIAPNMFGIGDDYDEEWDSLKANEHATRAVTQIENEDGLNPNTDRVHKAVEYASKGGGSVSARTKSGKRYHSKKRTKKITVKSRENGRKLSILELIVEAAKAIFKS